MCEYDELYAKLMELDATAGLPERLFIAVSTIMPVANVDLLVLDADGRVLLSWRDDHYFGRGWHLPGGCIRYKETMLERLQKTAVDELGAEVTVRNGPIAVKDVIMGKNNQSIRDRAHHLAVLYECRLPEDFVISNLGRSENTQGYLKWFRHIPEDILSVHDVYREVFEKYGLIHC